jgi:hypothetical protein
MGIGTSRGLIALVAGLCIVMLAVGVGAGALIWAGDDSPEDADDRPAEVQANVGEEGDGDQDAGNDSRTQVGIEASARSPSDMVVKVTAAWDAWNNCVDNPDYRTPTDLVVRYPGPTPSFTLGVTATSGGTCSYEESRMHWLLTYGSSSVYVELHKEAGQYATAACGASTGTQFDCRDYRDQGYVTVFVTDH